MKRRLLVQEERPSLRHPSVGYAIVAPPPHFVKAEVFTVFPDLVQHMDYHYIPLTTNRPPQQPSSTKDEGEEGGNTTKKVKVLLPSTSISPNASGDLYDASLTSTISRGPFCLITFQRVDPMTDTSLIAFSDEAAEFKDESREHFFDFMKEVQARLHLSSSDASSCGESPSSDQVERSSSLSAESASSKKKWFVDWVDPATGLPVQSNNTSSIYCESDGIEQLLKMGIVYVNGPGGGCRLVDHPRYGINVYPATGFVCGGTAEELLEALSGI